MSRSGYDVTAVDYHTDILEYREGIEVYNVDLLKEDLYTLGRFSAVAMIDCIEHFDLDGQRRVLSIARDSLAPGGILLIDTPNSDETKKRSKHHIREMTWKDFGTLVREAGFSVEKRYSIAWAADTFAVLLEEYSEASIDQLIVAKV